VGGTAARSSGPIRSTGAAGSVSEEIGPNAVRAVAGDRTHSASSEAIPPFLSVVLVFHNRLQFLPIALSSILGQTEDPLRFEVVVVGPERPPDLIERSAAPPVTFVPCREVGLGSKIAAGVRRCRGEVVTFLEDDDVYEPDRLAYLDARFRGDSRLVYLQNGFRTIDAEGRELPATGPDERAMARWSHRGPVEISDSRSDGDLRRLTGLPAGFNNSSIAVRRSRLESFLPVIETVDMLVDVSLFYGSLVQPGHVLLDPRPLTRLRKHPASNSDPRLAGEVEQLDHLLGFSRASQDRRAALLDFVRAHGTPAVVRAMEAHWSMGRLFLTLRDPQASVRDRARSLWSCLERVRTFEVRNYLLALPLALLVILAGRSGPRLYIRVRRRFYLQNG
jgi:hypothetical protein